MEFQENEKDYMDIMAFRGKHGNVAEDLHGNLEICMNLNDGSTHGNMTDRRSTI
jgi:hypothetical protein